MFNIAKIDLYRLVRSVSFYICMVFVIMMGFGMSMGQDNLTLNMLMGIATNVDPGDAFMTTMMGSGTLSIMIAIIVSLFIHSDFSSGYIKNVFSVHGNVKDYFFGKLMSFSIVSLLMNLAYLVVACIALLIFAGGVTVEGSIIGLLFFLVEKWILSFSFIALVLFIMLLTRKGVWGIIAGFIVGTGGISMMLPGLASMFGLSFFNILYAFTISGTSSGMIFTTSMGQFGHVIGITILWLALLSSATILIARKKDIL